MQIVNLKKYYYELFKKDTFVEVSDEVAEALLLMHREENNHKRKIWYHKAFYSLTGRTGLKTTPWILQTNPQKKSLWSRRKNASFC